jgi:hypothetical protein
MSALISESFDGHFYTSTYKHLASHSDCVKGMSSEEFDIVLELAADAYKRLHFSVDQRDIKDEIHKRVTEDTARLRADLRRAEERHVSELAALRASSVASEASSQKMKEQFENIQTAFKTSLSELSVNKDKQFSAELERLQKSHAAFIEVLGTRSAASESSLRQEIDSLRTSIAEKEAQLKRNLVSSERGKSGESEFDDLIEQHTTWGRPVDTSKIPHATDRLCIIRKSRILFELKNYTSNVPQSEVDKFYRDMEENPDSPLGVFISLRTNICNKIESGAVSLGWSKKGQILIFINNFYSLSAEHILDFIDVCVDISAAFAKATADRPSDSDSVLFLGQKIETVRFFIEKEVGRLAELARTFDTDKKQLIAAINRQHDNYSWHLGQMKQSFTGMIEVLLRSAPSVEPNVTEESTKSEEIIFSHDSEVASAPVSIPKKKAVPRKNKSNTSFINIESN